MFWKWRDGQSFNYRCTGRWNSGMEKSATAPAAATYPPTPITQLSSHPCTSPLSSCASSGVWGQLWKRWVAPTRTGRAGSHQNIEECMRVLLAGSALGKSSHWGITQ